MKFSNSLLRFETAFGRIERVDALYSHLKNTYRLSDDDLSDLLRGQLVNCVSALDRLVHDLIRETMCEMFVGNRKKSEGFKRFRISIEEYDQLSEQDISYTLRIFDGIVVSQIGHKSFQHPEKVKDGLNMIWDEGYKWQKISRDVGINEGDLTTTLNNIVIRRNQIVHEMDFDHFTGDVQRLSYEYVREAIHLIEKLGKSIYELTQENDVDAQKLS